MVTGGGTSGHINPAITIASALMKRYNRDGNSCKIIFTGRAKGLEGDLVPAAGFDFRDVPSKPIPLKPSLKIFPAAASILKGRRICKELIKEFKPMAVISTGGFSGVPLLYAAKKLHVPVIIHEANAFPGRANKVMGRKAALVMTGFPHQEKDFPKAEKVLFTGNPVRDIMFGNNMAESRMRLGIGPEEKFVFAMGGSLGAVTISDFIIKAARELPGVRFVLSAGKQHADEWNSVTNDLDNLTVLSYIDEPNVYMSAADVSILRAGAVTCAELGAVGGCGILIPYPYATFDHQTYNAECIAREGGCLVMKDSDVTEGKLMPVFKELLGNREKQMNLRRNVSKMAMPDTTERIVDAIDEVIRKDN